VGWATSARIDATLVCSALTRALSRYRPLQELVLHSDRGSQYTSDLFRTLLAKQPVPLEQSNGLSCFDNAVTESFFHTLKTELVFFQHYRTREEAHRSLFEYLEVFYGTAIPSGQQSTSPLLDRVRSPDGEAGEIFKKSSLTVWSTETGELYKNDL
jgi:transposase InsO family protein